MSKEKEKKFLERCYKLCNDNDKRIKELSSLIDIFIKLQRYREKFTKAKFKKYIFVFISFLSLFFILNIFSYIFAGVNIFTIKNSITKDNVTTEFAKKRGDSNVDSTTDIYTSFTDVKDDFNVMFSEPTFIPDNYKLENISVNKNERDNKLQISAKYTDNDNIIVFNVFIFLTGNVNAIFTTEKTEDDVIIEKYNKIEYLYSSNYDWNTIKWSEDNIAYVLSGPISKKELYKIIQNLKKEY